MIYGYRKSNSIMYHYMPKRVTTLEQAERYIREAFSGTGERVFIYHISDLAKPQSVYPPAKLLT